MHNLAACEAELYICTIHLLSMLNYFDVLTADYDLNDTLLLHI